MRYAQKMQQTLYELSLWRKLSQRRRQLCRLVDEGYTLTSSEVLEANQKLTTIVCELQLRAAAKLHAH